MFRRFVDCWCFVAGVYIPELAGEELNFDLTYFVLGTGYTVLFIYRPKRKKVACQISLKKAIDMGTKNSLKTLHVQATLPTCDRI